MQLSRFSSYTFGSSIPNERKDMQLKGFSLRVDFRIGLAMIFGARRKVCDYETERRSNRYNIH